MAQVYKKLEIDVNKEVTAIITAVQNDASSRYLDIVLLDGSTAINLTEHEVRIYGKKADGTEFYNNGEITNAPAGRCQFELTSQALAVAQDLEVQIILFKNNVEVLSTQPFKIHVVKSLLSASAIESSNEYGALVVLYQNLYEAYDLMTTMVQNMGEKGTIATERNVDTFWEMLEYMAEYLDTDITNLLNTVLAEASVQGVIDRLGETTDTGGTATTGTVMAKLNGLFYDIEKSIEQIVTDNDIIKACTNYRNTAFNIFEKTEILNVSGEGFVKSLNLNKATQGYTLTMKVYIDGELFFDFGLASNIQGAKNISFTSSATTDTCKISDLTAFVRGNTATNCGYTSNLLHFKESLRIVVGGSSSSDTVTIQYGLVG